MGIWITVQREDERRVRLKLEGRLVGDWVALLESECRRRLDDDKNVVLDCAEVSFAGPGGVEALKRLRAAGVELVDMPCLLAELLDAP